MAKPTIDDYRWLVDAAAEPFLAQATTSTGSLVSLVQRLRRELSLERAHLVIEQAELRQRAQAKFADADRMFFTRQLLEQSTDERIASYKATRFPAGERVADLCCGIGGDLMALLQRGPCEAIDRDEVAIVLAQANANVLTEIHPDVRVADIRAVINELRCAAWHIDPDRRTRSQRTSQLEFSEPGLDTVKQLLTRTPHGAMKLAPGADVDVAAMTGTSHEREWIGSRRECRQQVVWFGDLVRSEYQHTATVVRHDGVVESFHGHPYLEPRVAPPARFIHACDSTVVAAGLIGALANEYEMSALAYGPTYLTAMEEIDCPLADRFEVDELLKLDVKQLKRALRGRDIGNLEIKVRGVDLEPSQLRRRLRLSGAGDATLLVFKSGTQTQAAIAHRCRR